MEGRGTWTLISTYVVDHAGDTRRRVANPNNANWLLQITDPSGSYETQMNAVSSGDYSFDARMDGTHVYCFSNEHWSANSKEVSFNVHGIVYVPESEAQQDPLEAESACCWPCFLLPC